MAKHQWIAGETIVAQVLEVTIEGKSAVRAEPIDVFPDCESVSEMIVVGTEEPHGNSLLAG